jgi:hypothetical protein
MGLEPPCRLFSVDIGQRNVHENEIGLGKIKATIEGNKHFGLEKGRKLFVIAAEMPRDQDTLSIFWLWFTDDQKGVLFSECEIAQELKHALQVIDYVVFDQNADTHVDDTSFADPCYVPACTGEVASAVEMRLVPVIMHRPAAFIAAGETG